MERELFSGMSVFEFIQAKNREVAACADEARISTFGPTMGGLVQNVVATYKVEVPKLKGKDGFKSSVTDEGPRGATVRIVVPFVGDGRLFEVSPSQKAIPMPAAEVAPGALTFTYRSHDKNAAPVHNELEAGIKKIDEALRQLEIDLHHYNEAVQANVEAAFRRRETQLRGTNEFAKMFDFGKK